MAVPGSAGEHALQERNGTAKRAAAFYTMQLLDHLNPTMQEYITRQELVCIATADAHGKCDCSFRAGQPGFVRVLNRKLIVYPEYRGNGVMASLGNISENPHIGLIFLDLFDSTVGLHVNGQAKVVENVVLLNRPEVTDEIRADLETTDGRKPERWVLVEVEEAYIHCSKHIPLLKKLDKAIEWGTDDFAVKGGDYFKAKASPRPWRPVPGEDQPGDPAAACRLERREPRPLHAPTRTPNKRHATRPVWAALRLRFRRLRRGEAA